jgi:hypothetical protein
VLGLLHPQENETRSCSLSTSSCFVCNVDLIIRLMVQKISAHSSLIDFPINKSTIVHFSLGKPCCLFFNIVHGFFLIPFSVVLLIEGYDQPQLFLVLGHLFAIIL